MSSSEFILGPEGIPFIVAEGTLIDHPLGSLTFISPFVLRVSFTLSTFSTPCLSLFFPDCKK